MIAATQPPPPAPLTCTCGREHPWTWFDASTQAARWPVQARRGLLPAPMWAKPSVSPCALCRPATEASEKLRALRQEQRRVGIPEMFHGYTLERTSTQGPRDDLGRWMREVPAGHVGILHSQLEALRGLYRWRPTLGAGGSLYLWGSLGSGKSLWAALKVRQVLESSQVDLTPAPLPVGHMEAAWGSLTDANEGKARSAERRQRVAADLGRDRAYSAGRRWSTWWISLDHLVRDIQTKIRSSKIESIRDPLHRAATVSLLVVDDLGNEFEPTDYADDDGGWDVDRLRSDVRRTRGQYTADKRRDAFTALLNARYEARLPLIITSNLPPEVLLDEDGCPYGSREGSRLQHMVGGNVVELGRVSWRNPPPPAMPPRRRRAGGAP